jgi:hypothetical protein
VKEFKDGHRGDQIRRFTNAKQSESKAKVHSPGSPNTSSLYWGLQTRSVLENWINVSLTSRDWAMCHQLFPRQAGEFLVLDYHIRAVIFSRLQGLWVNKTLSYVTSHSFKSAGQDVFVWVFLTNIQTIILSHQVS